ncbi:MAG: type II toxin-antitoxin system Phd/YefM family antitoxin [Gaiellaceae bacterium]
MRSFTAAEFKAKCLALLDEVAETKEELLVTKRGKAVAKVVPAQEPRSLIGSAQRGHSPSRDRPDSAHLS